MNQIKVLRAQTKLTQRQFSNLTGIPLRTIQNWEQGKRQPPEWVIELLKERIEGKI